MHTEETITITLTSGGISPSKTRIDTRFGSAEIAFATEGEDAPTSVTVTSDDPNVPDTALFGGNSNSYAVPSTLAVQRVVFPEGVFGGITRNFTLTAIGQTAMISVFALIVGNPLQPKGGSTT